MNNRKSTSKNHQQTKQNEASLIDYSKAQDSKQYYAYRTQSKSIHSSSHRMALGEVTNVQTVNRSGKKFSGNEGSRPSSIEFSRNPDKQGSSGISSSKWLNSQKEMMEFIMNLKSKKSQGKMAKAVKITEGFQFNEDGQDKDDLLCNRMLNLKKVEKYQKQAINQFYEKKYEVCFAQLQKAENLIKREKIDTPQHLMYINYLYAEFHFKLQHHDKWKNYLAKAKHWSIKIPPHEAESMREYIMNIKALQICLDLSQEQYERVLKGVLQLRDQGSLSSKIRRRISAAEVTALKKLYRYREAMKVIDGECLAIQKDNEMNEEKKDMQLGKLVEVKIEMTAQFVSTQKAIQLIEEIINLEGVSDGRFQNFSFYNVKVYQIYCELLKKQQSNSIKLLFFLQKWFEKQPSKKQKLKLQLEMFKIYYKMGVYERALELFDQISSQNVVYLGPDYLFMLASIKHFYGEEKEAIGIMLKIIDICQDEQVKILNLFRILEFDLEQQSHHFRNQRENILEKTLKNYSGSNYDTIILLYAQYMERRGEFEKSKYYYNRVRKTANFCEFSGAIHANERSSFKR